MCVGLLVHVLRVIERVLSTRRHHRGLGALPSFLFLLAALLSKHGLVLFIKRRRRLQCDAMHLALNFISDKQCADVVLQIG